MEQRQSTTRTNLVGKEKEPEIIEWEATDDFKFILKALIAGVSLTKKELAAKLGITQAQLSHYLNRQRDTLPSIGEWKVLCELTGNMDKFPLLVTRLHLEAGSFSVKITKEQVGDNLELVSLLTYASIYFETGDEQFKPQEFSYHLGE